MSAELLRRAAEKLRNRAAHLEAHAALITEWAEAYAGQERAGDLTETDEAALDVARAILREEP